MDENGEPLVVYHGTRGRFWEFDERKIGKRHGALNGRGFYFTSSPYAAREYASNGMSGGRTIPAFLNIRHPDRHDIDALGADGVIGAEMYHDLFVVKHPNQIKSATDNAGTFSARPDIRYSVSLEHSLDALQSIADGGEYGVLHNGRYGEIRYPLGRPGKGGMGFLHIVEERMRKDGATLDEAIDTAIRVGQAAEIGEETSSRMNTRHLDYEGTRAIIALTENGNPIITGYEISADEPPAAYPSTEGRPPSPLERKETVIAALKKRIPQLREESKGRYSIGSIYTGSAADYAGTFSERPDIRYSVEVRNPWPADFPNATVLTTRDAVTRKHGELFAKAKAGGTRAAAALVREIMSDPKYRAKLAAIKERHPNAAIACPVHAEEEGGRNKIPRALATYAAKAIGLSVDTDIVQSVRAHHTGKDAFYRLTHRALFEGTVQAGREYVLVDDHITQGGTINELRNYIENNGGRVVDVFSLTASQGSTILKPSEKQLSELRKRYGNELDTLLGDGDIAASADAITASEAAYILKLSPDTFRDRVAEARRERLAEGDGRADGGRSRYSIEALGQTEFDFGDANPTGTPEENIERAKTEAQRVLDLIGGTELGNAINSDFKGEGQTTIIGRTVRTAGDLAAAAQIYRNPCFETFRYFFARGGKVVWQTSITARMPGQTPATVKGETFAELNRMIEALDPDGLWILHNHPSGDVTPSAQDVQMSGWFSQHHNQSSIVYSGHVIIDHDKYTFIPPDGSAPQERYRHFERNRASFHGSPTANPSLDNPLLGMPARNPAQVRAVALEAIRGQAAAEKKGGALTLVASSHGMVRAIATFPTDNVHEMRKNMRDYAAAIGALNMFVVGDIDFADYPKDVRIALASMCGAGEITDFIYEDAFFRTRSAVGNGMGPRKETQPQVEAVRVAESSGPRFSVVSDAATINRLDKEVEDGDYYVTYRAVERVTMPDGTEALVPPMNGYDPETRQYIDPAHEGDWLKADIDEAGIIDDGTGDYAHYKISYRVQNQKTGKWKRQDTTVAFNPYVHTSFNPFNDQFSAAYNRPNLVVVRMLVPKSAASGAKAHPRAKDAPGFAQWKAGVVASQLKALGKPERMVLLSNYAKIDKVLSYAEVADLFDEMADGVKDKISIPANVMPPALRSEMESRGYRIVSLERFSVTSLLAGGDASRELADATEPSEARIAELLEMAQGGAGRYNIEADPYFTPAANNTRDIPVALLRTRKNEPEKSIENAWGFMEKASRGEMERRKPIHVAANGDGTYTVIDGNATTWALARHGIPSARAVIVGKDRGTRLANSHYEIREEGVKDADGNKIALRTGGLDGMDATSEAAREKAYADAEENLPELEELTRKAAEKVGGKVLLHPANKAGDSGVDEREVGKRIKKRSRVEEKKADYSGDYSGVVDLIGTTITLTPDKDMSDAVKAIRENLPEGASVARVKFLSNPDNGGYWDVKVSVRFANGGIGEIIVADANLTEAKFKRGGHDLYDFQREVVADYKLNPSPKLKDLRDSLREIELAIYSHNTPQAAQYQAIWDSAKATASSSLTRLEGDAEMASSTSFDIGKLKDLLSGSQLISPASVNSVATPALSFIQNDISDTSNDRSILAQSGGNVKRNSITSRADASK